METGAQREKGAVLIFAEINHYRISALVAALATTLMAVIILLKDNKKPLTRCFAAHNLAIGAWAFGWYRMISAETMIASLFWARLLHIPASFLPATFLHFTQCLVGTSNQKIQIILRRTFYVLSFFFVLFSFHPSFVKSSFNLKDVGFYMEWGPSYFAFFLFFIVTMVVIFFILTTALINETGQKRTQIFLVLMAYLFGYFSGGLVFMPHFNHHVPLISLYGILICQFIILYSILRHRLLNLRTLVRRAGLMAVIYGTLVLLMGPLMMAEQGKWIRADLFIGRYFWPTVLFYSGILSTGPFLYAFFVKRNSYFHEHTLAGLAHELKSPLAAIDGAIELLSQPSKSSNWSEKERDYFEMIERNSARLRLVIDDLLQLFTIRDKSVLLSTSMTDLKKVCLDSIHTFEAQATSRNNTLRFNNPNESFIVLCDAAKIKQTISNLLSNSLKFTEQGTIDVRLSTKSGQINIEVIDTGKGISKDEIPHVFDRFFQGELGRQKKGSGIGLAIAKMWVEAHGGEIFVESAGLGKGSRFWFTIPQ